MPRSQSRFALPAKLRTDSPAFPRLLVVLLLLVLAIVFATASISKIIIGNYKQASIRQLERQVAAQQAKKDEYQRQKSLLESPEGATAKARRNGMVKPGETLVKFPPMKPDSAPLPLAEPVPHDKLTPGGVTLIILLACGALCLIGGSLHLYRWQNRRNQRPAGMLTPRSELARRRRHPQHSH